VWKTFVSEQGSKVTDEKSAASLSLFVFLKEYVGVARVTAPITSQLVYITLRREDRQRVTE